MQELEIPLWKIARQILIEVNKQFRQVIIEKQ